MPTYSVGSKTDERTFVSKGMPGFAIPVNKSPSNHINNVKDGHAHDKASCQKATNIRPRHYFSRCPHVVLIGKLSINDLQLKTQLARQRERKRMKMRRLKAIENNAHITNGNDNDNEEPSDENFESHSQNTSDEIEYLTCDACEQRKNLWICLREDCMFIGCGEQNSEQHSSMHAQNFHHPLSMNMSTRCVWCEICCCQVKLAENDPEYNFVTKQDPKYSSPTSPIFDDHNSQCNDYDYNLAKYLDQDIDPNRDDSLSPQNVFRNGSSSSLTYDDGHPVINGVVGLYNLGNTCYLNSAVQALSNCLPFTSFFLECTEYMLVNAQCSYKSNSNDVSSLSVCYLNLMRQIWQKKHNKVDPTGTNAIRLAVNPSELVRRVGELNVAFRDHDQHDSQELLNFLFEKLHEEMSVPSMSYEIALSETNKKIIMSMKKSYLSLISNSLLASKSNDNEQDKANNDSEVNGNENDYDEDNEDNEDDDRTVIQNSSASETTSQHGAKTKNTKKKKQHAKIRRSPGSDSEDGYITCSSNISTSVDDLSSSDLSASSRESSVLDESEMSSVSQSATRKLPKNKKATDTQAVSCKSYDDFFSMEQTSLSSIVSEVFEGKTIDQIKCLECKNLSTKTCIFQNLALDIPTYESVQAMYSKVDMRQKNAHYDDDDDDDDYSRQHKRNTKDDSNDNNDKDDYDDESKIEKDLKSISASSFDRNTSSKILNGNEIGSSQGWLSWIFDTVKGFVWYRSQTISLNDCLVAYFSDVDFQGDNKYECAKCKAYRNGVKRSKIIELPEVLCIYLKRFRYETSAGKINTEISFPLNDLDMKPFIHRNCKNECTKYDLFSVVCHHGYANGGHYTNFSKNYANEEWYEYDDSQCKEVKSVDVQNSQAYILFYRKQTSTVENIKQSLREHIWNRVESSNGNEHALDLSKALDGCYYISKKWLHRLKYFAEPGPIDNSDFLCHHNKVRPHMWKNIYQYTLRCHSATWQLLVDQFGVRYDLYEPNGMKTVRPRTECHQLVVCEQCQRDEEMLKQRQMHELTACLAFESNHLQQNGLMLESRSGQVNQTPAQTRHFAISTTWLKSWNKFINSKLMEKRSHKMLIPGKINNFAICTSKPPNDKANTTTHANKSNATTKKNENECFYLSKKANYRILSEEMWNFLYNIYGGGPILEIHNAINNSLSRVNPKY